MQTISMGWKPPKRKVVQRQPALDPKPWVGCFQENRYKRDSTAWITAHDTMLINNLRTGGPVSILSMLKRMKETC